MLEKDSRPITASYSSPGLSELRCRSVELRPAHRALLTPAGASADHALCRGNEGRMIKSELVMERYSAVYRALLADYHQAWLSDGC